MNIAVVGGGVGGLAAAIRLAAVGHSVTVLERRSVVGGKLATLERDGFVFDLGPSLLTLPGIFDELLEQVGTSVTAELDLVRLDPQFRYRWADGSTLVIPDGLDAAQAAIEEFSPGSGEPWRAFIEHGRRIWEVSERTFFAGPMQGRRQLLARMRSPADLWRIDPLRSLDRLARRRFGDPRLQQWAGRYATYSGSSPYRAPATLACIPAIEVDHGCWYPRGGLGALCSMLEIVARRNGVAIMTDAEVVSITGTERVDGVVLAGGDRVAADVVVANVDAEHLYGHLLDDPQMLSKVRRAEPSTSGFVICTGVDGRTSSGGSADIGHHNVWFSDDYRREFDDIAQGRFPAQPTIYGCVSSVTDPTQAPTGDENWFLLINVPAGCRIEREQATDIAFRRLEHFGIDIAARSRFVETLTPADIAERYRAPGGAIYGTSSNGLRAAFLRPGNLGARQGLYLVGGSSHPGGGLPLVTLSARIVAEQIGAA